MKGMTPLRWAVAVGCAYELAALHELSPLPTITEVLKTTHRHPIGRFLVWMWCGFVAWHFMEPPA